MEDDTIKLLAILALFGFVAYLVFNNVTINFNFSNVFPPGSFLNPTTPPADDDATPPADDDTTPPDDEASPDDETPPEDEPYEGSDEVNFGYSDCSVAAEAMGKDYYTWTTSLTDLDKCYEYAWEQCQTHGSWLEMYDWSPMYCCVWNCHVFG